MRTFNRRRISMVRFRKAKRIMRQRLRQQIFEQDRLRELAASSLPQVVILTGAGISAESGIETFHNIDGLWASYPIDEVATPEGYARDPEKVQAFYNQRRQQLQDAAVQPNAAHLALAKLEQSLGDKLLIITQNIDNLHERAGNKNVVHMHGELLKMRCPQSQQTITWRGDASADDWCTCCQYPALLRPHVVWFGEMPLYMAQICEALAKADLFIAIGTSGKVYPAASFVQQARQAGAFTIELNLGESEVSEAFSEHHYGLATKVVPAFTQRFLKFLTSELAIK
jgi:NAD-dependent deacetylase